MPLPFPSSNLCFCKKLLPSSWNSKKPVKPKGKGQKAPETKDKISERLVGHLPDGKDILFNFEERLQKLFYSLAVLPSIQCGLIPADNLTVSGDGTAVHTHASPRGHRSKYSPVPNGKDPASVQRHFTVPDALWGWDSGLDKFYYGYTLFQLSCYNSKIHTDIPLLLRFTNDRRHDSVSFLVAFHRLEKYMPSLSVTSMRLDSAIDNYPTYALLKQRNIRAIIDLNGNQGRPKAIPDTIRIDKDGTPICQQGLRMVPNGCDRSRGCLMWCCPSGKDHAAKCRCCCSSSKYGRVIKTKADWDIRPYTRFPAAPTLIKRSITSARQRNASITGFSMIMACTV